MKQIDLLILKMIEQFVEFSQIDLTDTSDEMSEKSVKAKILMSQEEVALFFKVYDKFTTGNSPWLDYEAPLDVFGKFANLFVPNLVTFIKTYRSKPEQFDQALATVKKNFTAISTFAQNNEKYKKLTDHVIEYLNGIEIDKENKIAELTKIVNDMHLLFEMRLTRAHDQLCILINKQNKTNDVVNAQKQIAAAIQKTKKTMDLDELPNYDPLLMSPEECVRFEKYLERNKKPYSKCICGEKAVIFSIPCSCPCYCYECFEEEDKEAKVCPRCGKPIREFVVVE